MSRESVFSEADEAALRAEIAKCWDDPLRFVLLVFPWGVPGTQLEHFPEGPDEWQRKQLNDIRDHIRSGKPIALRDATVSGHGIGKGHPLDMPYGDKLWGDFKPGDKIYGADGKLKKIISTNHYRREHFKVSFDDGSSVIVSGQHEWNVRGRQERRKNIEGWRTLETKQLLDLGVKRSNGKCKANQWEIPIQGAIELPECKGIVDPYTYGVWLGDGDKASGRITNLDEEVWEETPYLFNGKGPTRTLLGLITDLKKDGLFGCTTYNASVSKKYMLSSARLQVLQGLLDTDGWVEKCGSAAFSSVSRQLTKDVIWIARSLGLKAREEKFKGNEHAGSWTTHITWDGKVELFKIKRKQEKLIHAEHRYQCRWIESIESVGLMDGMCVEVEGSLYLTPDFHVTHNSAETSWIILWFVSTRPHCAGRITAGTQAQLTNTTWRELSVWHKRALNSHWFKWTATRFFAVESPETWGVSAVPWSEHNSDAFAGLHAEDVLVMFDEASTIADVIWEVTEGAMTTPGAFWFVYGNPVRNTGRFRECFRAFRHRWGTRQIDSRSCRMTNKEEIKQWEDDYGEDSDFFRVRVKGMFPRASSAQLISEQDAEDARLRVIPKRVYERYPVVIGVDVARYGDDRTVLIRRQGPQVWAPVVYRGLSTMQVAAKAFEMWQEFQADAVCVDGIGVGAGVVDRLTELNAPVVDVQSAESAEDSRKYFNCRSELWGRTAEWIKDAALPDDKELIYELTAVEYGYNAKMQIQVEATDSIKKRINLSPDIATSLVMTMADSDKIARVMAQENRPRARTIKQSGIRAWT